MKKKKYLYLIPSFEYGGAERSIINFANECSKFRDVTILSLNKNGHLKKQINKKIKIDIFKKKNFLNKFISLIKYIKKNNFDFVITSILHLNVVLCIIKFLFINNSAKIIIRPSNILRPHSDKIFTKILFYYFKILSYFFYKYSDKVICIDKDIKELLTHKYKIKPSKIIQINNPTLNKKIINLKKNKKINISKKFFLSIGSLTKQKNFSFLIKIFSKFNDNKKYELLIIGDGYEKNKLLKLKKKLSLSNIKILKSTDNPYKYLKKCELYISTSLWEGQPNVMIEAAYLSKKILTTFKNESVKKILKLRNNYIISSKDKIRKILKDLNIILNIKTKMKSNVYFHYSSLNNTKKLINGIEK